MKIYFLTVKPSLTCCFFVRLDVLACNRQLADILLEQCMHGDKVHFNILMLHLFFSPTGLKQPQAQQQTWNNYKSQVSISTPKVEEKTLE